MATDDPTRQAVVVIHGIGEQRPMQTLRAFVETLLEAPPKPPWWALVCGRAHAQEQASPRFYSKPDRLTDTLELRRLASGPPHVPLHTDFYELYWAHLMEGTAWSHIVAWAGMLMFRLPIGAHCRIKLLWAATWFLGAVVAYLAYMHELPTSISDLLGYGAVGVLALAVLRAFRGFGLGLVGDAARYLSPTPQNINARKSIRNAVMQSLARLHDEQPMRYGRIIVVGHSLGSVIAYDALTHLWQQRHSVITKPRPLDQQKMEALRQAAERLDEAAADRATKKLVLAQLLDAYRIAQRALLAEQQALGVEWRITDLVTLGSPLTHACFLLADNQRDWDELLRERVYPTSPPQPEDRRDDGQLVKHFTFPDDKTPFDLTVLHHAALFACTRWTNLYYASDPIGGEVAGAKRFGSGIEDVRLEPVGLVARWTPLSHTRYWDRRQEHARQALCDALDLSDAAGPNAMFHL